MKASHKRRSSPKRDGYTFIEVMMAVSVMMVGAVGIMSLQQATTVGNRHARQMETATQITRSWLERLELDARNWTSPTNAVGTTFINGNLPTLPALQGAWALPAGASFDFQGMSSTLANATYCTNIRLSWVGSNTGLRVDVRTWWHRTSASAAVSNPSAITNCGTPVAVTNELALAVPRIHAVFGSTVVLWNNSGNP